MKLIAFRDLIVNLPVRQQAFTSRKETWQKRLTKMPNELAGLFGSNSTATVSRDDLFRMAGDGSIQQFIYGILLWAYPRGWRGNNFLQLAGTMEQLTRHLCEIKDAGNRISDWERHWRACFINAGTRAQIRGIGISTYSKLLYFMKTKANGYQCLILDQVLIDVFAARKFDEFPQLGGISYQSASTFYPTYLELMQNESLSLGVAADQLEMFLFMFGSILK